jgi:uncharacterized protein with FMN-binding domain
MKRVILAITSTVAGLVALLSFKTHGGPIGLVALPSAGVAPSDSADSPSPGGASAPDSTSAGAGDPSASAPAGTEERTVTGQAEQTRYGVVQVKVTKVGDKITDVAFVQLTATDGRSRMINSQAAPILLQQTLQAQSADIDGVSGASYTSQGYVASLQSALDQL